MSTLVKWTFFGVLFLAALRIAWPWITAIFSVAAGFVLLVLAWFISTVAPMLPYLIGVVLIISVIRHGREIIRFGGQAIRYATDFLIRKVRGIGSPSQWSANGFLAVSTWLIVAGLLVCVPIMTLQGEIGSEGTLKLVVAFGMAGLGAVAVGLLVFALLWKFAEWWRSPQKQLAGYGKLLIVSACLCMPLGYAHWIFGVSALFLFSVGFVIMATADLRDQARHREQKM